MNALLHHCRREHSQLNVQAFPCHLANIVPKDSKCSHYCVLILIIIVIILSGLADSEEGLVVLQTMVEGMVLEAHVSSGNATEPSPVHLVELYSQYGSQVCVCVCVCARMCVCVRGRLFLHPSADAHIYQQRAGGPGCRCLEGGLLLIL